MEKQSTMPDPRRLERLERMARRMDARFRIPGTAIRFGWDSILGLVPGAGDVISGLVSLAILREARSAGLGKVGQARMLGNIGIDALAGSVPVLGDLFDLAFRANQRNLDILRAHLGLPPAPASSPAADDEPESPRLLAGLVVLTVFAALVLVVILVTSWGRSAP